MGVGRCENEVYRSVGKGEGGGEREDCVSLDYACHVQPYRSPPDTFNPHRLKARECSVCQFRLLHSLRCKKGICHNVQGTVGRV